MTRTVATDKTVRDSRIAAPLRRPRTNGCTQRLKATVTPFSVTLQRPIDTLVVVAQTIGVAAHNDGRDSVTGKIFHYSPITNHYSLVLIESAPIRNHP
jgi:hypothetical protein